MGRGSWPRSRRENRSAKRVAIQAFARAIPWFRNRPAGVAAPTLLLEAAAPCINRSSLKISLCRLFLAAWSSDAPALFSCRFDPSVSSVIVTCGTRAGRLHKTILRQQAHQLLPFGASQICFGDLDDNFPNGAVYATAPQC